MNSSSFGLNIFILLNTNKTNKFPQTLLWDKSYFWLKYRSIFMHPYLRFPYFSFSTPRSNQTTLKGSKSSSVCPYWQNWGETWIKRLSLKRGTGFSRRVPFLQEMTLRRQNYRLIQTPPHFLSIWTRWARFWTFQGRPITPASAERKIRKPYIWLV